MGLFHRVVETKDQEKKGLLRKAESEFVQSPDENARQEASGEQSHDEARSAAVRYKQGESGENKRPNPDPDISSPNTLDEKKKR